MMRSALRRSDQLELRRGIKCDMEWLKRDFMFHVRVGSVALSILLTTLCEERNGNTGFKISAHYEPSTIDFWR
jgi:hypothetical protein